MQKPPDIPVSAQLALAADITSKVMRHEVWQDDAGNVTGLILINHPHLA
jgi:hypothetical protein